MKKQEKTKEEILAEYNRGLIFVVGNISAYEKCIKQGNKESATKHFDAAKNRYSAITKLKDIDTVYNDVMTYVRRAE